jgi:Ca2+-binding RTX toxin-like protein
MAAGAFMQGTTLVVNGSSGDDAIVVAPTGTPGQVDVTIDGTDFGTFSPAAATVSGFGGSDDMVVAGVPATVDGGSGDDRVTGPDVDGQVWDITGANSGTVGTLQFTGVERLKGGVFADVFRFGPDGSISGRVEGNDDPDDTIDYSLLVGPITVNENLHTASRIGGTYFGIENVIGSASPGDTMISNGSFFMHDTDGGATHRSDSAGYIRFSSIENLSSTAAVTFKAFPGGAITGSLNVGPGSTIDYSQSGLHGVVVDLNAGKASQVGGTISGIRNVEATTGDDTLLGNGEDNQFFGDDGNDFLVGGGGNDSLDGGSNDDVVLGGAGDDALDGGGGKDIVIGGAGSDVLVGSDGNDILFGGKTVAALDPLLSGDAIGNLAKIRAEWTRTDLGYHDRISHLMKGGGLNGNLVLNSSTLSDDGAADSLTGNAGNDWFIVTDTKKDTVVDPNVPTPEVVTKL